jgi:hypothetical protein
LAERGVGAEGDFPAAGAFFAGVVGLFAAAPLDFDGAGFFAAPPADFALAAVPPAFFAGAAFVGAAFVGADLFDAAVADVLVAFLAAAPVAAVFFDAALGADFDEGEDFLMLLDAAADVFLAVAVFFGGLAAAFFAVPVADFFVELDTFFTAFATTFFAGPTAFFEVLAAAFFDLAAVVLFWAFFAAGTFAVTAFRFVVEVAAPPDDRDTCCSTRGRLLSQRCASWPSVRCLPSPTEGAPR